MAGYFFNYIRKIPYDINSNRQQRDFQIVTNILFRSSLREQVLNNTTLYTNYLVRDGETPEIVAENYYDDPHAHWLVMYANLVLDPLYDWPLDYRTFRQYIIDKYGSVESAKTTIHHHEKVINTTDSLTGLTTVKKITIDATDPRTNKGDPDLPFDVYDELAESSFPNISGTFSDGSSVTIEIGRNIVYNYDYEDQLNEDRRNISLIDRRYYPQIKREYERLTRETPRFLRRL